MHYVDSIIYHIYAHVYLSRYVRDGFQLPTERWEIILVFICIPFVYHISLSIYCLYLFDQDIVWVCFLNQAARVKPYLLNVSLRLCYTLKCTSKDWNTSDWIENATNLCLINSQQLQQNHIANTFQTIVSLLEFQVLWIVGSSAPTSMTAHFPVDCFNVFRVVYTIHKTKHNTRNGRQSSSCCDTYGTTAMCLQKQRCIQNSRSQMLKLFMHI